MTKIKKGWRKLRRGTRLRADDKFAIANGFIELGLVMRLTSNVIGRKIRRAHIGHGEYIRKIKS